MITLDSSPVNYTSVKFELNQKQIDKLNEWLVEVEKKAAHAQAVEIARGESADWLRAKKLPFYGLGVDGIVISFQWTCFGYLCQAKESITGETIYLTDLDN